MKSNGWRETTFDDLIRSGDIIQIQDGNHGELHPKASDYVDSGIPFVMANNISSSNRIELSTCYRISKKHAESLRIGHSRVGDVLLTHKGTLGRTALVEEEHGELMLTPQVTYYRLNQKGVLNRRFLYHFFQSPDFQKTLARMGGQSTRAYVGISQQKKLACIIPPSGEQEKIARMLSTWDEAIEKLGRQIKRLEVNFEWFLADLLSPNKTKNREQIWRVYKLSELANFINGRGFKQSEWTSTGLPIIRIQNMNGSSEFNYYDGEYDKRHFINRGDLLFSWSGNRGTSFGPNIWSESPGLLNQHIFKVENTELISKEFLYLVLKYATRIIESKAHGGSGLVHVTKSELEKFEVDLPGDKSLFLAMSDLLLIKEAELKLLNRKLELFRIQKQGLMQQLLTGKKTVEV